jgi:cbb3-type cytochrome oxidase maturation protein
MMEYLEAFLMHAILIGSVLMFVVAAVWALSWAIRDGQFENFHRGAMSIFDADEPVGEPHDFILGTPTNQVEPNNQQ